jgi:hypothetical protein
VNRHVWIGLVHLIPRQGNNILEECIGAYANAVALASDEIEFRSRINAAAALLDFDVADLEDVEPFQSRSTDYEIDPELRVIAEQAAESGEVVFDTFEAYAFDESDGRSMSNDGPP